MGFSAKASDYDFTIHDANGVVGVKDGVEHIIKKDDWDRENPHIEHRDSGCTECRFVQDKETIFIYLVSRDIKDKVTNKPLLVGKFTMTGWTGHYGFYLFRCESCSHVSVDRLHGYTDFGLMYLRCDFCQKILPIEVTNEREIYETEGVYIPKPTREERLQDLNNVIARVEQKGIKVIVASSENRHKPKIGFLKLLRKRFNF